MSNWRDIGHGHRIQLTQPDAETGIRHFVDDHRNANVPPGPCGGSGRVLAPGQPRPADGKPYWTLESEEPLTLSPSLLCTACGDHGWVRDGKWVTA